MTQREQQTLTRKVQRDIFEDRATVEGPLFGASCSLCDSKTPHTLQECEKRIGTNQ